MVMCAWSGKSKFSTTNHFYKREKKTSFKHYQDANNKPQLKPHTAGLMKNTPVKQLRYHVKKFETIITSLTFFKTRIYFHKHLEPNLQIDTFWLEPCPSNNTILSLKGGRGGPKIWNLSPPHTKFSKSIVYRF